MELPPLFYVDQSDRGRLKFTGRDRQSFLQGMVTNDVAKLAPGAGCYAFMLDATGHILSDARILCRDEFLLMDVEPGMASFVAETLDKYLIMERVKITDIGEETAQFFVGGTEVSHFFETLAVPGITEWIEGHNGLIATGNSETFPAFVAVTRLIPGSGFTVYLAKEDAEGFRAYLANSGAELLAPETLEALRIEAGIPRFGVDMDSRVLAPETKQEARAISYKKGCYIGQEIVARIDARGRVNRGLTGFRLLGGNPPEPDTAVQVEGKDVGRVTSSAISPTYGVPIALGYIRREHEEPGASVTINGENAVVFTPPLILEG